MNAELTERLRKALTGLPLVEEKRMFGGTAFMVDGKLDYNGKARASR